ncbi:bile acid:sodium symporter [Pseudoalteromonas phenolica]|uniref:Bile acid:sodium symporter n=1 Tax=Pseudoalteromonas phenolica TaxID=161398 RepID=A0A4Q7IJU2_9GAMM|nr:bile acid:sodium symporter family protein [Pseudoalteromonas phenolica]RZQ51669.1 bile acid:sodium symporter [Pseudoalteromonas phenolica]
MISTFSSLQPETFSDNKANLRINSWPIVSKFALLSLKVTAGDRFIIQSSGYLAKGDVALSVTMTAVSTLLGVVFTPLLTSLFLNQLIDIPVLGMLMSLVKIVLLPIIIGVLLNHWFAQSLDGFSKILPLFAMLAIIFIISIIVALNQEKLQTLSVLLVVAVMCHNILGLLLGYWVPKRFGFNEQVCRTVAFEVGMQNSGLAVALAIKFFTPAAAIAGTLFSIWHNISGSILAGYWHKKSAK